MRNAKYKGFPLRTPHSALRIGRRGSVLLYVVWVVMLLSLFAASVGSQSLFALDLSQRLAEQLQALYIARSAVPYATLALARDVTPTVDGLSESWANDAPSFHHRTLGTGWFEIQGELGGQAARYGLTDEERRINLNTAPARVLQRLLELIGGLKPNDAEEVAAAIEDWRDPDTDQRSVGAEGFYYRSLRYPYDCKDGPFENVEELLLVKGVSPEVYAKIAPYVTVYGSGGLNLNTASETALRTLGLSQAGFTGLLTYRAGEDGQPDTGDERTLISIAAIASELQPYVPAEDLVRLTQLVKEEFLTVHSEAFRMAIDAESKHPTSHVHAEAVIDRKGNVLLWSER